MNFLAHAYLARNSESLLIGNFIADFVKGNQIDKYDNDIIRGIRMHRKIDDFTDKHPVFKKSKKRILLKYRHYSGVIIDLFYDHFLAKNWDDYANQSLEQFVDRTYQTMKDHMDIMPPRVKSILPFMIKYNWLVNYKTVDGIDQSLKGLSRRTSYPSGMEHASLDLIKHYSSFEKDFNDFFPEIIQYTLMNSININID